MKNTLIIMGSARSNGITHKFVSHIIEGQDVEFIDLLTTNIKPYDYQFQNQDDDFLLIAEKMISADNIIFATPIYWYTMSGIMKNFFDRCSDLITIHKELGRKLRNKSVYLVSTSSGSEIPKGFSIPFLGFSSYLNMNFKGNLHGWIENNQFPVAVLDKVQDFVNKVFKEKKISVN